MANTVGNNVVSRFGTGKSDAVLQSESASPNPVDYKAAEIPMGCSDIAKGLGIPPQNTLWDFDWVTPSKNGTKKDDLQQHQNIMTLIRGKATGMTLKLPEGFLDYLQTYAGVTNVVEVTDTLPQSDDDIPYPFNSVIMQAYKNSLSNPRLRHLFQESTYCACLPVKEVQAVVSDLGGKTLITDRQTKLFNSKARVAEQASKAGYLFAPHVIVHNRNELWSGFQKLRSNAQLLGLDPYNTKFWIKFDNLAGGDGVLPFDPDTTSFDDVKEWVDSIVAETKDTPEQDMFPIVMDIDIGSIPGVRKILGNFNVQAIVGTPGITITGTTMQDTRDGVYLGGKTPQTKVEKAMALEAQKWAVPVLSAAKTQGYQGYAGIDVMMVENAKGTAIGYIIEMNGRLNSSTSLLSTAQWARKESTEKFDFAAKNIVTTFLPTNDFAALENRFSSVLFRGKSSGFSGIIPIHLDFNRTIGIHGAKFIAIAPDVNSLKRVEHDCDKALRSFSIT